jgi:hypothetical protein
LSSTAEDEFFRYTTHFCTSCYRNLLAGDDAAIDPSRITIERLGGLLG